MAYEDGALPSAVRGRVETLRCLPEDDFYDNPIFEHDDRRPPTQYAVRLGNRCYPHMKLSLDRAPDGRGYVLRANTHDQHCCPYPRSREYNAFVQLMANNHRIALAIETAWESAGLPTFKTYLRQDLLRRTAATASS